jgi:hypothetical protein
MYLSTIDLYELGQYLRIVLWICLPLIIISLLVTTWLHYRRRMLDQGGLRLSVEGGDSLSYGEHDPDKHAEQDPANHVERNPHTYAERDPGDNDQWGKESVTEWKGKDNIYQGILWMKEKYEQFRNQADQRYELLKENLNRSERRYQDLLLSMEENKSSPSATAVPVTPEAQSSDVRQQLDARQLIIEELEEQLRVERLKVEDLVARLQSNSQLLLNIYQELDNSAHIAKETE